MNFFKIQIAYLNSDARKYIMLNQVFIRIFLKSSKSNNFYQDFFIWIPFHPHDTNNIFFEQL